MKNKRITNLDAYRRGHLIEFVINGEKVSGAIIYGRFPILFVEYGAEIYYINARTGKAIKEHWAYKMIQICRNKEKS